MLLICGQPMDLLYLLKPCGDFFLLFIYHNYSLFEPSFNKIPSRIYLKLCKLYINFNFLMFQLIY